MNDVRERAANRTPRPLFESTVELGLFLEGDGLPLALAANEVEAIVGRPPQNFTTGEGHEPGFPGLRYFAREIALHYRRADGKTLVYEYEGALAYALAEIHDEAEA